LYRAGVDSALKICSSLNLETCRTLLRPQNKQFYSQGQYQDGVEEGIGSISYSDGNTLEGEFSDGQIDGHAVFRYPNGDQREGFFRENVLDGQVIYTKANGRIAIELWNNGQRLVDKEQIIHEGEETTTFQVQTVSQVPQVPQVKESQFDLTDLRNAIRSGDKTQVFFGTSEESNPRPRRPKVEDTQNEARQLRLDTDRRNRDFLYSVFQRVNG
jgi:hypothetical protein